MFCALERIEIKVDLCPARNCMYRDTVGKCRYEQLTVDDVEAEEVASAKGIKLYKAKAEMNKASQVLTLAMVAKRYSEFIRESWPKTPTQKVAQTVNGGEVGLIRRTLFVVFGLSEYQQDKFLDEARFNDWARRASLDLPFSELKTALVAASSTL